MRAQMDTCFGPLKEVPNSWAACSSYLFMAARYRAGAASPSSLRIRIQLLSSKLSGSSAKERVKYQHLLWRVYRPTSCRLDVYTADLKCAAH